MKVVVAPDGFGGTLSALEAAEAIAAGWRDQRPGDEVVTVPLSDGGEGLLAVLAAAEDRRVTVEVAGPQGHPVEAPFLLRPDGSAVIESALACGLALVPEDRRTPMVATTFGVGELLEAARGAGARRILVGLGGSATVDGGAGALLGLGFRVLVEDGSGLKIGGDDLRRVAAVERGWSADWADVEVELLADVTTALPDAARVFGPQKGASPEDVETLTAALERWADVVERDLVPGRALREEPATGAAGGLGFALAAAIGARFRVGSVVVGDLVGLPDAVQTADLVITGEGRLDATTGQGKVVDHVTGLARAAGRPVQAVVGQVRDHPGTLDDVEAAAPDGPGEDPSAEVAAAARRLATRFGG